MVSVDLDRFQDFQILDISVPSLNVTWLRPSFSDSTGAGYRYYPTAVGPDTLLARIVYPEYILDHRWFIEVVPPAPVVWFFPPDSTIQIIETLTTDLRAYSNRPQVTEYIWTVDGMSAGQDSTYTYQAVSGGSENVRCEVIAAGESFVEQWTIQAQPLTEIDLPLVSEVGVARSDPQSGVIHVLWDRLDSWYVSIAEYRILLSFDGPITGENRDLARLLSVVPQNSESASYKTSYVAYELEPASSGAMAWFSVVAVDERGKTSAPAPAPAILFPCFWFIEGRVLDLYGEPLSQVSVDDPVSLRRTLADESGGYRIGPFYDTEIVTLSTGPSIDDDGNISETGLYFATSGPQTRDGDRYHDFLLFPRYRTDPNCLTYAGEFLTYLRDITLTTSHSIGESGSILHKWDRYPLEIHVPEYVGPTGIDFADATRNAIGIWNDKLGEEYFVIVDDPSLARVRMAFGADATNLYGLVELLEPPAETWGSVIPQVAQVSLYNSILTQFNAEVVGLHELGHVLGFHAHAACNQAGYLMYRAPSCSTDDWPEHAIHIDELRAIKAVRSLRQGTDMSCYFIE
jgi:hypothetical protein